MKGKVQWPIVLVGVLRVVVATGLLGGVTLAGLHIGRVVECLDAGLVQAGSSYRLLERPAPVSRCQPSSSAKSLPE